MRSLWKLLWVVGLFVLSGCASKQLTVNSGKMADAYRGTIESQVVSNLYRASSQHDLYPSHLVVTEGAVGVKDSFTPGVSIPTASQQTITNVISTSSTVTTAEMVPATTVSLGASFSNDLSFKLIPVDNEVAVKRMRALYLCAAYEINTNDFVKMYMVENSEKLSEFDTKNVVVTMENKGKAGVVETKRTESYKEKKVKGEDPKKSNTDKTEVAVGASLDCSKYNYDDKAINSEEGCLCIYWKYAKFVNHLPDTQHRLPITSEASLGLRTIFVKDMHVFQDFVQETQRIVTQAVKSKT